MLVGARSVGKVQRFRLGVENQFLRSGSFAPVGVSAECRCCFAGSHVRGGGRLNRLALARMVDGTLGLFPVGVVNLYLRLSSARPSVLDLKPLAPLRVLPLCLPGTILQLSQ